jgi:flagellar basal body rod protein FlgF
MQTYILRIYRGNRENSFQVGGVIENVENQDYQIFQNLEGLFRIVSEWAQERKNKPDRDAAPDIPDAPDMEKRRRR